MWRDLGDVDRRSPHCSCPSSRCSCCSVGSWLAPRVPWGLLALVGAAIVVSELRKTSAASAASATVGPVPAGVADAGTARASPIRPLVPGVLFGGGWRWGPSSESGRGPLGGAAVRAPSGGYPVDSNQGAAGRRRGGEPRCRVLGRARRRRQPVQDRRGGPGRRQVAGGGPERPSLIVVVVLVAFVGSIAPLPKAVLSAIVVHAVWGLMDLASMKRYRRVRRNDFVAANGRAKGGVLVLGTPVRAARGDRPGPSSAWCTARRRWTPRSWARSAGRRRPGGAPPGIRSARTVPRVLVLRLDAPIFWVNAADVRDRIPIAAVDAAPGTPRC